MGHVAKNGKNDFQKYAYPKWEDVNEKLSPLLTENGLIVVQTEQSRSLLESNDQGSVLAIVYHFTLVNEDGDAWPEIEWTAIARLRDQKGITDDKAAAKCHTQGEKYFCLKAFKIRIGEEIDSDKDDGTGRGQKENGAINQNPHTVTVANGGAKAWKRVFVEAIQSAGPKTIEAWIELNEHTLEKLKNADAALYAETIKEIEKRRVDMNPPTPPEPPAIEAPKVETAATMEAKTSDYDFVPHNEAPVTHSNAAGMTTTGRTVNPAEPPNPPGTDVLGGKPDTDAIPPGLRRAKGPPPFKLDAWMTTLKKECEDKTPAQLLDLREKMIEPLKERLGHEGYNKAGDVLGAAMEVAQKKYAPAKPAFDPDAWYNDLSGAISGCTSIEQIIEVQKKVQQPALELVSREHYAKGKKLVQAALIQLSDED